MFVNVAEFDYPIDKDLDDVEKAYTVARGQIMLQAQLENSLWAIKQPKARHASNRNGILRKDRLFRS